MAGDSASSAFQKQSRPDDRSTHQQLAHRNVGLMIGEDERMLWWDVLPCDGSLGYRVLNEVERRLFDLHV